jgi:hypothetical protein
MATVEGVAVIEFRLPCRSRAGAAAFRACRAVVMLFVGLLGLPVAVADEPTHDIVVVIGAPGESTYASGFAEAAQAWQEAARRAGAAIVTRGLEPSNSDQDDREWLREALAARAAESSIPLWLVYVGHGTFDGREARLNLRGPDVTARELAAWLEPIRRPMLFIHGGSASAPFLSALSRPDRIIITATRSGHELNYARFGERFAAVVADPTADIDQDGQTSVLEAFVTAAQQVQSFYAETGRLATEHALIDDNGDGQGTPAEWFRGTRVQRQAQGGAEPDGARAGLIALVTTDDERRLSPAQREQRDRWERELADLRLRQAELPEEHYYRELERILRQLAAIYRDS